MAACISMNILKATANWWRLPYVNSTSRKLLYVKNKKKSVSWETRKRDRKNYPKLKENWDTKTNATRDPWLDPTTNNVRKHSETMRFESGLRSGWGWPVSVGVVRGLPCSQKTAALFLGEVFPWTGVTLKFSKKKKKEKGRQTRVCCVCVGDVTSWIQVISILYSLYYPLYFSIIPTNVHNKSFNVSPGLSVWLAKLRISWQKYFRSSSVRWRSLANRLLLWR